MARLLWLFLSIPILMLVGFIYQRVGALKDRRRYLGQGRIIEIGQNCRLYVSEMGAGGPTVVFESGVAAPCQNWLRMQQAVSSFTHTLSYDRGGLGWSSRAVSERTPSNLVRELRILLQKAQVPPPYVLVGHSFGCLVIRRFAVDHPEEVTGVVLVDAMRPEEWPPLDNSRRGMLEHCWRLSFVGLFMAKLGISRVLTTSLFHRSGRMSRAFSRVCGPRAMRVLDRVTCEIEKMPREVWPIVAAHWSDTGFYRGIAAHLHDIPKSIAETDASNPIEGVPVIMLTAGNAKPLSTEGLSRIGTDTQQVMAWKSGHWIHLDEPDLVLEAIRGMVQPSANPVPEEVEALRY
jgi:pimeloyl-ACP methyl ester carboxylesterase